MAPRTDRTTRVPPGVTSPVTTDHAAKGSVFVNSRTAGTFKNLHAVTEEDAPMLEEREIWRQCVCVCVCVFARDRERER